MPEYIPDGYHTLESARHEWYQGAPADDVVLATFLDAAKVSCVAYAPAIPVGGVVPSHYRLAQLMQAQNLLAASRTDPGQSMDGEMFVIRPYPLDNFIKQLLRPKRAVGLVG